MYLICNKDFFLQPLMNSVNTITLRLKMKVIKYVSDAENVFDYLDLWILQKMCKLTRDTGDEQKDPAVHLLPVRRQMRGAMNT